MKPFLHSVGQKVVYNNVRVIVLAGVGYKGLVVYEIQDTKRFARLQSIFMEGAHMLHRSG